MPVVMPALGESVTEGTITRWLKAPGDPVAKGEPLVEVATDKVDTEIESPLSGTLLSILVPEDRTVPVGAELALIDDGGSPVHPMTGAAAATPPVSQPTQDTSPTADESTATRPVTATAPSAASRPFVTPAVRALVREYDVDLHLVVGSGQGGRVTRRDVDAAIAAGTDTSSSLPSPRVPIATAAVGSGRDRTVAGAGRIEKLSRLRRTIATRMVDSLHVSAQLTTVVEVDMSRVAAIRAKHNSEVAATGDQKFSFLPFVCRATCEALAAHPSVNASIDLDAGTVTHHDGVSLGVAVDTERGLLVPVIPAADDLNVPGLARRIADVAARTRSGLISPDELSGGTFTVTNTGSRGALFDTPIINQPQVAILGMGAVVKRPVVTSAEGQDVISIRSMAYLALTYDHRLVDGADAARFLGTIKSRLEAGNFEADAL
jgi:2-oxoglutarate dehydrogenase E2 component (dihydrolipoamide succinyltransferase)